MKPPLEEIPMDGEVEEKKIRNPSFYLKHRV